MDKYPRMFIISSIVYLLMGTFFGTLMASRAIDAWFRFVHIHLNLFGFMAMMVFGVAYHILPRFMGKSVRWPALIPIHFYSANLGLAGMMVAYIAGGYLDPDRKMAGIFFEMFAGFSMLAVILFAVNMIPVLILTERKAPAAAPSPPPTAPPVEKKAAVTVHADMKISEVLEARPETLGVFINAGFKALADPEKRKSMGEKLVIKTACQIRGINLDELLAKLNGPISEEEVKGAAAPPPPPSAPASGPALSLKRGEMVTLKTPVGHMIQVYPETKRVLEENYGGECFSCPGMAIETIEQTANMHSRDPQDILGQINAIVAEAIKKG